MSSPIRAALLAIVWMASSAGGARAGTLDAFDEGSRARLRMDAAGLLPLPAAPGAYGPTGASTPRARRSPRRSGIGRLDLLRLRPVPTAFERSFVVRIAKVFIDKVQVAQVAGLRIRFKIILE